VPIFAVSKPGFEETATSEHAGMAEHSNECGHILYTSGTTGNYKKCLLTARTQEPRDRQRCEYYHWDRNTRFHGLSFGLWTSIGYNLPPSVWSVGGCVLFDQEVYWPSRFFDNAPNFVFLLPDQALQLCEAVNPRFLKAEKSHNLVLHVGGGFLSSRVAEMLRKNVSENIVITYGSSEINSASFEQAYQTVEDLSWITPTGNRAIEIVDEQEKSCLTNEKGHLRVKLTALDTQEYLDDPAASTAAFRDGYFYPGDMAVQRDDGKFRILGRIADVVNLGGQKWSVAPIEANLQNILQVDYVCLFSGMDSSGETVIAVAMEATEPPDQDRINHVGQELSQWDNVRFAYISPFPRTQSGASKIDRKRLRELIFPD
jgi:acyl-coenzyme A synthetase/AMP-(fatty) acid ligase